MLHWSAMHHLRTHLPRRLIAVLAVFCLAAVACGSSNSAAVDLGDTETATDTARPTVPAVEPTAVPPAASVTPVATPVPEGSIQDVAAATVKIIAEGTFVPPFELQQNNVAGIGTGFIIDEAGTLVTNNHVVTGAVSIEVFLDGATEPTPARLLGVSECSDLAVMQLEGDGYEFLEFRGMEGVVPGLPVFAAGYPLNLDRDFALVDYTLTAGIVSTTQASGETSWASIDAVIEHDARIRGGNSGGPLVDEQGRVVGINYAGEETNDLNEAIAAAEARPTIDALRGGDVESLGINGQAVFDGSVTGVWVAAVASGTPADQAGLIPGDLILTMDGRELATDGTMSDYCEIVRAAGSTQTIDIEVLRLGSQEILEGQINGEPLMSVVSLGDDLSDQMTDGGDTYTSYDLVNDETDSVAVEIPTAWTERDGGFNAEFGESIFASTDLVAFQDTWDVPGIILERSDERTSADIDDVLDIWDLDCDDSNGRSDFATDDGVFTGKWEIWTDCGGTAAAAITLAVSPPSGDSVVRMFIQMVTNADIDAAERALATFDAIA